MLSMFRETFHIHSAIRATVLEINSMQLELLWVCSRTDQVPLPLRFLDILKTFVILVINSLCL